MHPMLALLLGAGVIVIVLAVMAGRRRGPARTKDHHLTTYGHGYIHGSIGVGSLGNDGGGGGGDSGGGGGC